METEILNRINTQVDQKQPKKDTTQVDKSKTELTIDKDITKKEPNGDVTFLYTSHEMKFKELENGLKKIRKDADDDVIFSEQNRILFDE